MVKFSIIVPIYNIDKYLELCLDSILKQSYSDFEVIMINDGSTDLSLDIMKKYEKKDKRFKSYTKKNGGLSDARNYGIKLARGEYFLLVDGDDTINSDLLSELVKEIDRSKKVDLIKFNVLKQNGTSSTCNRIKTFSKLNGEEAFLKLVDNDLFVTAWSYLYNKEFFIKNNFSYEKGRVHEDFGLTPLVVVKASSVSAIDYVGYNYVIRDNSIMTSNTLDRLKKKNEDVLYFFDSYIEMIPKININDWTKEVLESYIANVLICRTKILNGKLKKEYVNELKERNVYKYLLSNTLIRKIKKWFYKIAPNLYVDLFVR